MKNYINKIKDKLNKKPKLKKVIKILYRLITIFSIGFTIFTILLLLLNGCDNKKVNKPLVQAFRSYGDKITYLAVDELSQYTFFQSIINYFNEENTAVDYFTDKNADTNTFYKVWGYTNPQNGYNGYLFKLKDVDFASSDLPNSSNAVYMFQHFAFKQFANPVQYTKSWRYYQLYLWDSPNLADTPKIRVSYRITPNLTGTYEGYTYRSQVELYSNGAWNVFDTYSNQYVIGFEYNSNYLLNFYNATYQYTHNVAEVDYAYQTGYDQGFNNGSVAGVDIGKAIGYIQGYDEGHIAGVEYGLEAGYDNGYSDGVIAGSDATYLANPFSVITQAFDSVGDFLNIEILPKLKIGVLVFIPVIFAIIVVIVKMIRG